jgi:hypothetical protein
MAKKGCIGSQGFDPDQQVKDDTARENALEHLRNDQLRDAVTAWFKLPRADVYPYHAMTTVRLPQVQEVVNAGGVNGLHDWYRGEDRKPVSECTGRPTLPWPAGS